MVVVYVRDYDYSGWVVNRYDSFLKCRFSVPEDVQIAGAVREDKVEPAVII